MFYENKEKFPKWDNYLYQIIFANIYCTIYSIIKDEKRYAAEPSRDSSGKPTARGTRARTCNG
jgi:hypothetical protein